MEGNVKPYWNDHPSQTFDTNLNWYLRVFSSDERMYRILEDHQRQYYTTKEVFGILCRWYGKSVEPTAAKYGWTGNEESLGEAFAWMMVSSDLDSALSYSGDNFDPYKPQPYTAYDIFRILYRLKYGEWLPAQAKFGGASADFSSADEFEALDYGLDKNGRPWALEAKYSRGSPIDGREPSTPLKPPKKVHDGDALFSAIDRMGRK